MIKVNLSGFSRRTVLGAAVAVPGVAGAAWLLRQYMGFDNDFGAGPSGDSVEFKVYSTGYGPDPELLYPERMVWPSRLTEVQRDLLSRTADEILPAKDTWPSASEQGVPSFLDEWLSAPYPDQVADFELIIPLLDKVAKEDMALGSGSLNEDPLRSSMWAPAISRLTELAVAGYFCCRHGNELLGFIGNQPSDRFLGPPDKVVSLLERRLDQL